MSGFGYNILGFGASASAGDIGVGTALGYRNSGTDWDNIGIQAGDLAIVTLRTISFGKNFTDTTNPSLTQVAGYTELLTEDSEGSWSPGYTEGGAIYYKILAGNESVSLSWMNWVVVRFDKPVSEVTISNTTSSGTKALTYNYSASNSKSVLRIIFSSGYNLSGNQRDAWENDEGNEINSDELSGLGSTVRATGLMVTTTQGSGTLVCSGGNFTRLSIASTITVS